MTTCAGSNVQRHLRRSRRAELVAEIRDHIQTALAEEQAADEAAVRNVLDRLGPPEEIVEAAEPPPGSPRAGALEVLALIALLLPVLGWLVGTVLAFASRVWSRRDKLIGALLLLVTTVVLGLGFVSASGGTEESTPPGDSRPVGEEVEDPLRPGPLESVLLDVGLPTALYLAWQLRRDRRSTSAES